MRREKLVDDSATLNDRLAELEAKVAIHELTARYNETWDNGLLKEWVETWTPDGAFVMAGAPVTVGSQALLTMVEAMQSVGFVHLTTNPRIDVNNDTARQTCTAILASRSAGRKPGTSVWLTTGRYHDDLLRSVNGWRFARRSFLPDASLSGLPKWW